MHRIILALAMIASVSPAMAQTGGFMVPYGPGGGQPTPFMATPLGNGATLFTMPYQQQYQPPAFQQFNSTPQTFGGFHAPGWCNASAGPCQ
jgi:hypothetical protein